MPNKRKLPNVLRPEQLKRLFDVVEDPKYMIIYLTTFFCGLRLSEICRLKVKDIDLEGGTMLIRDAKNPKRRIERYGKDRKIPIAEALNNIIKLWLEYIGENSYFIPLRNGEQKPFSNQLIQRKMSRDLARAGLREIDTYDKSGRKLHKYSFHTLRHSHATYLRDKGIGLDVIGELLGHTDTRTTMIYNHLSIEKKKRDIDKVFSNKTFDQLVETRITEKQQIADTINIDPLQEVRLSLAQGKITPQQFDEIVKRLAPNKDTNYIG